MTLTIRSAAARGVLVPLKFLLGTSVAVVRAVPLLLLDVETEEGVTGRTYVFCYTVSGARAVAGHVQEAIGLVGQGPVTPAEVGAMLRRRFGLLGVTGTVQMALSAIDMALWDALARMAGLPLCAMLGASPRPLPAYDSRGLGIMAPDALADEAERLLEAGLRVVKVRLGYPTLAEDVAAVEAVRRRVGKTAEIMVDYNQALTVAEALRRGRALDDHGLIWIEEPIAHDDYAGLAAIAGALKTPVQAGENLNGPAAMAQAIAAGASDCVMPDVARIGGVTGWVQAAGLAAAAGLEMSSHLMPEVSAQLLCMTPGAHYLEYVDWADGMLQERLRVVDGRVTPLAGPGNGMIWDEARLARLETI